MKTCIKCGSHAFNLYAEGIDQGGLCDVHYWQGRAHRAEALAQPEQEPVAWAVVGEGKFGEYKIGRETESNLDALKYWTNRDYSLVPLYTTPPKRPWVGLTKDDINECYGRAWSDLNLEIHTAIEAKLKEKNT